MPIAYAYIHYSLHRKIGNTVSNSKRKRESMHALMTNPAGRTTTLFWSCAVMLLKNKKQGHRCGDCERSCCLRKPNASQKESWVVVKTIHTLCMRCSVCLEPCMTLNHADTCLASCQPFFYFPLPLPRHGPEKK